MVKGLFITFEGGEGAGKTTLIQRLSQEMQKMGCSLLQTRAPGSLKLGEKIRDLLLNTKKGEVPPLSELFLFLADRASHVEKEILPALKEGKIVLCDRFNDSTVAYQGFARGLGESQVKKLCELACSGLQPALTLYLDIDPAKGLKRAKNLGPSDRIESEKLDFHHSIRNAYLKLAKEEPNRIVILNAEQSPEQVYHEAWQHIAKHLPHFAKA